MNNDELITAVHEAVTDVHTATPVGEIISRGRTARARRRIPAIAGTLAAVTGTVLGLGLTGVLGAAPAAAQARSGPSPPPPAAQARSGPRPSPSPAMPTAPTR